MQGSSNERDALCEGQRLPIGPAHVHHEGWSVVPVHVPVPSGPPVQGRCCSLVVLWSGDWGEAQARKGEAREVESGALCSLHAR